MHFGFQPVPYFDVSFALKPIVAVGAKLNRGDKRIVCAKLTVRLSVMIDGKLSAYHPYSLENKSPMHTD
jgi:hypothetical protein